ncbi:DUF6998 domain-containing protein [Agromyces laixinhei]|uniref:DUF6998 domain-containing protein n=1 Tax=Agromyces laixinhei TaxID=2585717 RepID=UPI0018DAF671|nr:hypothetical protein [Agromyces laixinhei]
MTDGIAPAELARELGASQRRIRAFLRSQWGKLDTWTTRWVLTEEQITAVRGHFASDDAKRPLSDIDVNDLLSQYAEILSELRARGVCRTGNAPLGDYAEYLAQSVYGGELAANSAKSYDLIDAAGRRVQVKARTVSPQTSPSSVFSVFRTFDFDVALFLVFDQATYELMWAAELGPQEIEAAARWSSHVNGRLLRVRKARELGVDVTARFDAASV